MKKRPHNKTHKCFCPSDYCYMRITTIITATSVLARLLCLLYLLSLFLIYKFIFSFFSFFFLFGASLFVHFFLVFFFKFRNSPSNLTVDYFHLICWIECVFDLVVMINTWIHLRLSYGRLNSDIRQNFIINVWRNILTIVSCSVW